ncbi:MAG: hypothetical protein HY716_18560 [Planctomycetes bacterium]|nr:hypothetical protein [Planctomycetota bacterium]
MRTPTFIPRHLYFLVLVLAGLLIPGQVVTPQEDNGQGQGHGRKKNSTATSSSDTATTYSGRATVVKASVLGVTTTISDTGDLPSEGGALEASLLSTNVAGLVSANVCHATTIGQGHCSKSEASLADLSLTVGANIISCSFAMACAHAQCDGNGNASVSGSSKLTALSVNGEGVAISGAANQENVAFVGLRIIINEQISSVNGNCAEITVNALHVICTDVLQGTTLADVVICSAHADICCGGAAGPHAQVWDFLTGGGFITGTPSGAKGNFGVAGGIKNGAFWGHLNYIDHGTGMHVKHITITGYDATGPNERRITGTCRIDGEEGHTFSVFAADNGEPGTNDTFNIFLSNGYSAGGYLGGGNIQLHMN